MNKQDNKKAQNKKFVEKSEEYKEEYSYDFIPTLHEWVNIDEQKENVHRLENIEKSKKNN